MTSQKELNVVAEIKKRYGRVIDLDKSPMAIIEIIYNYRFLLDEVAGPDGTGGGPPGSVRVTSVTGTTADGDATLVVNLLLELRRDVQALSDRMK
jgi:hypothetical protein